MPPHCCASESRQSQHNSSIACCVLNNILMIKNPTMDVNAVDKENITAGVSSGDDAAVAAAGE